MYLPGEMPLSQCPALFSASVAQVSDIQNKRTKKRTSPSEKWPKIFEEAESGKISDKTLIKTAIEYMQERVTIVCQTASGDGYKWPGIKRGDYQYICRQRAQVHDGVNIMVSEQSKIIFATLTFDGCLLSRNQITSYQRTTSLLQKFLRKIKTKFGSERVWVLEAQESGSPHYHVAFSIPKAKFGIWIDKKGKKRIKEYALWKSIKALWPYGHSDFMVCDDEQAGNYVSKYICKSMGVKDLQAMQSRGVLSPSERKHLLTIMLPILAQRRMYGISNSLNKRIKAVWDTRLSSVGLKPSELIREKKEICDSAIDLIRFKNNLTSKCIKKVWIFGQDSIIAGLLDEMPPKIEADDKIWAMIETHKTCAGCNNCRCIQALTGELLHVEPELYSRIDYQWNLELDFDSKIV